MTSIQIELSDELRAISTQLNVHNYSYWSYVMTHFLCDKKMWKYVYGTKTFTMKPLIIDTSSSNVLIAFEHKFED